MVWERWNLKEELQRARDKDTGYKIKTEGTHDPSCPYCGHLNRARRYRNKSVYKRCEACGKISKLHNQHGSSG